MQPLISCGCKLPPFAVAKRSSGMYPSESCSRFGGGSCRAVQHAREGIRRERQIEAFGRAGNQLLASFSTSLIPPPIHALPLLTDHIEQAGVVEGGGSAEQGVPSPPGRLRLGRAHTEGLQRGESLLLSVYLFTCLLVSLYRDRLSTSVFRFK